MHVKDDFFKRGYLKIGDGTTVRFWEDVWMGMCPYLINIQHSIILYNIKIC
jgi:hypothetical protein